MFKDYLIYDNILDDPNFFLETAKKTAYFSSDDNFISGLKKNDNEMHRPTGEWKGIRSSHLQLINDELFDKFANAIFKKVFVFNDKIIWRYIMESYFHFSPGYILKSNDWWHIDDNSIFSGVIYLNKTPDVDSGTTLIINDTEVKIDNVYNRLVLYRSNLYHQPTNCFGNDLDNCRLTITFFINELGFSTFKSW